MSPSTYPVSAGHSKTVLAPAVHSGGHGPRGNRDVNSSHQAVHDCGITAKNVTLGTVTSRAVSASSSAATLVNPNPYDHSRASINGKVASNFTVADHLRKDEVIFGEKKLLGDYDTADIAVDAATYYAANDVETAAGKKKRNRAHKKATRHAETNVAPTPSAPNLSYRNIYTGTPAARNGTGNNAGNGSGGRAILGGPSLASGMVGCVLA
ncbi:hypothetical protein MMC19_005190 [Ptychographa xylographoides]|nr:hypothetical protein [Ptychographa xylographoides]